MSEEEAKEEEEEGILVIRVMDDGFEDGKVFGMFCVCQEIRLYEYNGILDIRKWNGSMRMGTKEFPTWIDFFHFFFGEHFSYRNGEALVVDEYWWVFTVM